jgi:hypothetical protein
MRCTIASAFSLSCFHLFKFQLDIVLSHIWILLPPRPSDPEHFLQQLFTVQICAADILTGQFIPSASRPPPRRLEALGLKFPRSMKYSLCSPFPPDKWINVSGPCTAGQSSPSLLSPDSRQSVLCPPHSSPICPTSSSCVTGNCIRTE